MAIVIPVSCGGGNDDSPEPALNPQQTKSDVSGLDNLKTKNLQVDVETDLLSSITFNNGTELSKVQIVFEGVNSVIDDPKHFTPAYPGTCSIILTVKSKGGKTTDYQVDNLTIRPLEYRFVKITNIKPSDILPIV